MISLVFGACAATPPPVSEDAAARARASSFASAPPDRPGLGTNWGEKRISPVGNASFERANFNHSFAVAAIYYSDEAGIRAMAGTAAWERRVPVLPVLPDPAAALVTIKLRDQSGSRLPGLIVGDRWFVVGEEGRRYTIALRNRSDLRLELCFRSTDSMSSMADPASFRKRGYILNPHQKLVVKGFWQSSEAVAAFRFSPVRESYAAEKYHNTRNVGVIGIALFNEMGSDPWSDEEVRRRLKANPFPGRSNGVAHPPPLCIVREPCQNFSSRPTVAR